jgi:hypothetical protein
MDMTDDQYQRFIRMEIELEQLRKDTAMQFTNLRNIEAKVDSILRTVDAGKISWKILAAIGAAILGALTFLPWILKHVQFVNP